MRAQQRRNVTRVQEHLYHDQVDTVIHELQLKIVRNGPFCVFLNAPTILHIWLMNFSCFDGRKPDLKKSTFDLDFCDLMKILFNNFWFYDFFDSAFKIFKLERVYGHFFSIYSLAQKPSIKFKK